MESKLREILPQNLVKRLEDMGETGKPGILIIDNFPIDSHIPKADHLDSVYKKLQEKTRTSEKAMLGTVEISGYMFQANPNEQNGMVPNQIAPVRGKEKTVSGKGQEPFDWHVENPFTKTSEMPKFLMLFCLEGDSNAKTSFFFVENFIKSLPKWVTEEMKKDIFHIKSGAGFDGVVQGVFPLLSHDEHGRLQLRLYEGQTAVERLAVIDPKNNKKAVEALFHIQEELKKLRLNGDAREAGEYGSVSLQPGQALIFNNAWGKDASEENMISGIMHGRDGRIVNFDRWLQRGFFVDKTQEHIEATADGYGRALYHMVFNKKIPVSESSSRLRDAICFSDSALEYKKKNPKANNSQVALYGIDIKSDSPKSDWLMRVAKEATKNGF
jgi:hypothetical protein